VPEVLHALGIVADEQKPDYHLITPDGRTVIAEPPSLLVNDLVAAIQTAANGNLLGSKPEAVARRAEEIWSRVIAPSKVFYIAYNHTGTDASAAIADMRAALDAKTADHVVLDLRYARGGDIRRAADLTAALAGDVRVNRPGGLVILIGRESITSTTLLASMLEQQTKAVFVGEPTPGRPNTLLGASVFTLKHSGIVVFIAGTLTPIAGPNDTRDAIRPKVAVALTAADFFAGKDPALDAAFKAP
jgi:C-terminal processing protease CtpA/Prc